MTETRKKARLLEAASRDRERQKQNREESSLIRSNFHMIIYERTIFLCGNTHTVHGVEQYDIHKHEYIPLDKNKCVSSFGIPFLS